MFVGRRKPRLLVVALVSMEKTDRAGRDFLERVLSMAEGVVDIAAGECEPENVTQLF